MQRPDATPTEGGWAPLEQTAAGPVQTPVTGGSPAPAEAAAPVIGAAG
ncbi:peptide-binding protein, partial [Plantibacter sp. CFBP 13570]|nr:peptide-binding protein [Plantibacter sp. CFBP 13570]